MRGIEWWFCCLALPERTVLQLTATIWAGSVGVGVPVGVWNGIWDGYPYCGQARRDAFLAIFGLQIATIEDGGLPVEVVRPQSTVVGTWVAWALYVLTPPAGCPDGCEQSKLPWQD